MLKAAVIILAIGHIFAGLYASITFIAPKMMLESTFESITGKSLDSVQEPDHLEVMINRQRKAGFYALTAIVFALFVLFSGFRRAEKWAWWCFLLGGGLTWLWGVIDYVILGSKMHIILQSVGLIIFLIGVLLPTKIFFAKAK